MEAFILLVMLGVVLSSMSSARAATGEKDPLVEALIWKESRGRDWLQSETEEAFGCLQITDICREDINRIYHTNYTRKDCFNRAKSIEMFWLYVDFYATYDRLGGVNPTDEDRARIWNGGPTGWLKEATEGYWAEVRKRLLGILARRGVSGQGKGASDA